MKNNKITNNFLKKVVGPDNLEAVKKIIKQLEKGHETEEEIIKEINKNKKEITPNTVEKLLLKLKEASITTYEETGETEAIKKWTFNEEILNEKIEEFAKQNEIINNPIVNDFLSEKVDVNDIEYGKYIILSLIDGIETDEAIHEKTGIKLNTVRKLLYKLHDASIASYKRNKDPETQWFTYTWKFDKEEYVTEITKFYNKRLSEREELLDNLENNLYFKCCMDPEHFKGDYTESSECEFYCPICDYELEPYDAKEEKDALTKAIKKDKRDFNKFEKAIKSE
jgi:transcription initiation factor TFIIE subunit alpha